MNWPVASKKQTGKYLIDVIGMRSFLILALFVLLAGWLTIETGSAKSSGNATDQIVSKWLTESLQSTRSDSAGVIEWQVFAGAVTNSSSENYALIATAGQPADGIGSSENYSISGGFLEVESGTCCNAPIRGNVNYDQGDVIDISDLVYLVDYMFIGGAPPPCFEEADIDGSSGIDISDLVYLVDYMFNGGPPPVACP